MASIKDNEIKKRKATLHKQVNQMNGFIQEIIKMTGVQMNEQEKTKLFNLAQMFKSIPGDLITKCKYVHGTFMVKDEINESNS